MNFLSGLLDLSLELSWMEQLLRDNASQGKKPLNFFQFPRNAALYGLQR